MKPRRPDADPYSLIGAIQAHRLAQSSELLAERTRRNAGLAAILARLDAARQEHVESYLAQRLRRETSHDLS